MTMDGVASSIAHEIKQPLSAIVTNAGAALRWLKREPPEVKEVSAILTSIADDGLRANEVIGSIRAMFGREHSKRSLLDLNDLVRDDLSLVRLELGTQRVSLQLELAEGLPQVIADRLQLQQTFLNLFINAIEAMNPVTDRPRSLSVKSERCDSRDILITVADSGIGIDSAYADRILEAFFTTKSGGTGMRLALCRSIIEAHGGRLWASSHEPHGTIFHVQLPGVASNDE